jgi:hypothetical protein
MFKVWQIMDFCLFGFKLRNQALFYLLRAYELGEDNAPSYVHKVFGDRIPPPKSITYLKEIQKFYEEKK